MSLPSIILDTDKTTPIYELPLKIRQGDTGDELQVTLGKSFQKYTDLSTVDVELIAKTPDQRLIKQAVTDKSGNTFKVNFPDEMYTNVGVFRNMYFKIGDDSTSDIKLVVLQGIGSIKEAGSYIDDFETLIEEAESYVLALKDFSDNGNAKIDDKVAELTGKMTDFVDKSKEDLDAAKAAWSTFQSSSQTAFTDAQDKRASDFNSQKAGFETDFGKQKTDFENRFKALLATLQSDYDDFKALINKDVVDLNTSLDNLSSRATGIENRYDAIKAQLDALEVPEIGGRNLLVGTGTLSQSSQNLITEDKFNGNSVIKIPYTTDFPGNASYYDAITEMTSISVHKGQYTLSFYAKSDNTGDVIRCYFFSSSVMTTGGITSQNVKVITTDGEVPFSLTTGWKKYWVTWDNDGSLATKKVVIGRISKKDSNKGAIYITSPMFVEGNVPRDWVPAPEDVQTAIKNALDKANYSTTAEVDSKISTGVGQAKTYAEQSIKDIIGAAPETLDTIGELADAVTKNKDGVQAINEGITKKADKTDVTALQNTVQTMITPISQADYDKLVSAGTVDPKIMYVIPDA
jgi:hypothetical protein